MLAVSVSIVCALVVTAIAMLAVALCTCGGRADDGMDKVEPYLEEDTDE